MNSLIKKTAIRTLKILPIHLQNTIIEQYLCYKKRKIGFLKTPTAIILYVTNKCNLRCGHCFYWQSLNQQSNELRLNEIDRLANSLQHSVTLSLTGGEPFLRGDLRQLIDTFVKTRKVKEIGIASNGFMTDEIVSFCDHFCQENGDIPLSIQISLDGMESTHDSIRKVKGSFKRALLTLERLLKTKNKYSSFSVSAGIAVQKKNFDEIPEVIDLLGAKGVELRINLIRGETSGTFGITNHDSSHINPKEGDDIAPDLKEMRLLYSILCRKNEMYHFWTKRHKRIYEICMQVLETKKKVVDCYAGTIDCVIYSNGDVSFCELTKPVGNLRDFGCNLEKLWSSSSAHSMRLKVKKCFCIHGCNITTSLMFRPEIVKETIFKQ